MLEKLFTSKNRVKIIRFFLFEKNKSYIREISKLLGIPVSAVKREVENLVFIGLVRKEKNEIILDKRCNFLEDIKNLFIKTDAIVYPIKEVLNDKNVEYALVFGSFAAGNYNSESDVDLMVVGKINLSDIYRFLKPAEKKIKRDINPVVWTEENLRKQKNSGFVKDILRKGFIMIKGNENELREIIK